VPLDRLARLMAPFTVLIGDMPLGALDLPAIRYELPAHVSWYEEMDRSGGEHLVVMLLDGDEVAAVCNAHWEKRFPDRVFQALTAVARPWRGKGLAKGAKAAMLKLVRERHPEVRMIVTHNAEVNAPMLSINRRLGFGVYRQTVSYQIDRESLGRRLGEPRGVRPPPAPFR
jgi:GNAT superfamily N-acetyltransferase